MRSGRDPVARGVKINCQIEDDRPSNVEQVSIGLSSSERRQSASLEGGCKRAATWEDGPPQTWRPACGGHSRTPVGWHRRARCRLEGENYGNTPPHDRVVSRFSYPTVISYKGTPRRPRGRRRQARHVIVPVISLRDTSASDRRLYSGPHGCTDDDTRAHGTGPYNIEPLYAHIAHLTERVVVRVTLSTRLVEASHARRPA